MKKWSDWLDWWDKDSSLEVKYIESNSGHTTKMIWSSVNGEGSLEIISGKFSDSLKTISFILMDWYPTMKLFGILNL